MITTTNGTRAIVTAAAHAETVVIGSLANLTSCAARGRAEARARRSGDVLVQCAGVQGEFTMDDAYTAGRFVQELAVWLAEWELSDAARAAEAISRSFESGGEGLGASQSARNLRAADLLRRRPLLRARERARGRADGGRRRCRRGPDHRLSRFRVSAGGGTATGREPSPRGGLAWSHKEALRAPKGRRPISLGRVSRRHGVGGTLDPSVHRGVFDALVWGHI